MSLPRVICRCLGISSRSVEAACVRLALRDVDGIARATGAGAGCTSCREELVEVLADLTGDPLPPAVRSRNRERTRTETMRRVEQALYGAIAARLPPGARVELIATEGLQVELFFAAGDAPELRALVAERLQKLVCAELEVRFG